MSSFPYTDETGRRIRPQPITFEILWYSGGPEHAPNCVIGRDFVKRTDLSDAITAACNMLRKGRGHAADAHGFYVRSMREAGKTSRAILESRKKAR